MAGNPKPPRILLLEKDALQRQIIREYLEMDGRYKVIGASTAARARGILERANFRPALALLDVESSQALGMKLCKQIKKYRPSLPILGMTDYQVKDYRERRSKQTWDGFISKPFAPKQLHLRIEALLRH